MKVRKLVALLAAAGLVQVAHTSYAAEELDRVEVTGSSIKRVNAEQASPVQVITARQIESMGARTLMQVLDNLPAAKPGQQDFRSMYTGSDGASQANLRGLGAQGTLVLLNGRRLSFYGAPEGFQTQFVNIDAIPAAAIERMEVLTDGASAVYGSDAIAGVINVITKRSYQGLQMSVTTDHSREVKAFGEHQLSATYGFGDFDRDRFNIYGSVNLFQRDRIAFSDTYLKRPEQFYVNNPNFISNLRIGVGSEPGVMNPGSLFVFDSKNVRTSMAAPGCNNVFTSGANKTCVVNGLPNQFDTGPKSERATGYLAGRLNISPDMEGFAEFVYTDVNLRGERGPGSFSSGQTINWYSRNTGTKLNTFVAPFLGPNNEYNKLTPELQAKMGGAAGLSYLLQDAPGHFGQETTDKSYRAMAGVRGTLFGSWDYETALSVAGSDSTVFQTVNINTVGVEKAFGPFTVDPVSKRSFIPDHPAYQFGVINEKNAALIREAFPTFDIRSHTKLISLDGKIEGKVATLPAGDVRAAFGYNLMRESFETPGNKDAADGHITQQGGSWFDGQRTIGALFSEAIVPITKSLEMDAAVRLDKYPNFAANLAPKVGLKFRAMPELLLRGTYSQGFRAPNLAESGEGGVFAQRGGMKDTIRCNETNAIANQLKKSVDKADQDLGKNLLNSNCSNNIAGLTPPNKDLKPETAKSGTLGLVFQPGKDFDISADYWLIQRRDEIIRQDFQELYDQYAEKYGPTLAGAPGVIRSPITDTDRSNVAAAAAMCANPANAAACTGKPLNYSVGLLAGMSNSYLNRGRTLVDGFDIDARGRFSLGEMGRLNLGIAATIMNRNKHDDALGDGFSQNYVGYYGQPKYRATFNADWRFQNFGSSLFVNYTGGTKWAYDKTDEENNNPTSCTAADVALPANLCGGAPAFYTVNLGFNWEPIKTLNLGLNIKNVLNKQPEYDPNGWEGYNHAQNLFGRVFSVSASYKFW
ncbi:TonB-dependent receptor [Paucibacter sp. TC2R-5]|uniref:TonB-dependent receptor domain-containing protein n=1 Tax=Paucibacter sp. TC2R-5 TaxID=2893555 RepID=UPI0021E3BB87|nr:TonB-dependent receptor [Paucibacter sp. TC2R-5]MCV2359897.1 TonB-dependent receptor [Paucibacter sp. TC2R-5]